jgi:aminopeptidase
MSDSRLENLAKILVQYSTNVQPGDRIAILAQPVAMPLVEEIYRGILKAGGFPYYLVGGLRSRVETDRLAYLLFTEGTDEQIQHIHQFEKKIREEFEGMITLYSQENTRALSSVPPSKQSDRAKAFIDVTKIYQARSASGEFKWALSLYPTHAYAQDAEMSLPEFEDYVYGTTFANTDDPVAAWNGIHDEQQRLVDWLKGKKMLEVKGPNVDLKLSIEGRSFINSDGHKNMPSGEIYTSPVEDSTEGWVRFTYPAIRESREVDGIELVFEEGKVVKASAAKNEEFLNAMLDTDKGSRYLGEFAIGTNKRINKFIKSILFDEKIGGTIHMAIGYGFTEAGSKNESAIHWDMICDMREGGQITADGELFYDSGEFKI